MARTDIYGTCDRGIYDKLYQQIKRDHPEAKITWRQVAAFLRRTQPHQLFLYQRKPKPISVFRRSRPLQLLTVDLTALPVQTLPDKTQASSQLASSQLASSQLASR